MDTPWVNGNEASDVPAEVVLLQPVALVDHLCCVDEESAHRLTGGELGGSSRCSTEQLQQLLVQVGEFTCRAGGSASNVARGLSSGFGVSTAVVGACGRDEWGTLWHASMKRSGVNTQHVINLPGATGRSVVLLAAGERSCRTHLDPQVSFPGHRLQQQHLQGAAWLFVSSYAAYQDDLLPRALHLAKELGVRVALDLASWEVLACHWQIIRDTLQQGTVDLCFCNQEEAKQLCKLLQLPEVHTPEAALHYLLQHCNTAVVTLGANGCIAGTHANTLATRSSSRPSRMSSMLHKAATVPPDGIDGSASVVTTDGVGQVQLGSIGLPNPAAALQQQQHVSGVVDGGVQVCTAAAAGAAAAAGLEIVRQPGVAGVQVVDVTGAGDMFAAGFLHGMVRGWPLQRCAEAACLSGAAAVQVLGADVGRAQLHWMHQHLLGPHAAQVLAEAAGQVAREQLAAFGLVEKIGRGVVYFGNARVQQGSQLWQQTEQLAEQVSRLLGVPTWSGGGPGVMQAATQGALAAGGPVGGIRIVKEAGSTVLSGHYLPEDAQVLCHHLSTRKSGLIQAGCRRSPDDTTAFIFLPGGLGTMDELFELLTLMQLRKLPQQQQQLPQQQQRRQLPQQQQQQQQQLPQQQQQQMPQQQQQQQGSGGCDEVGAAKGGAVGAAGQGLATPVVLVDYEGFYQGFITFLQACEQHHMLRAEELKGVMVASSNSAVLQLLAQFYGLPVPTELQLDGSAPAATALLGASAAQQQQQQQQQ